MERVKKTKAKPTLDSLLFVTPEQKLLRFLVSQSTTTFTPRVLSSKLKGVRGLGGADGLNRILKSLQEVGLVEFKDNDRAVSAQNDHTAVRFLKTFSSYCDLEGIRELLETLSIKGVLYGSRATGEARSDSNYNLLVITNFPAEVLDAVEKHPMGRDIALNAVTPDQAAELQNKDPILAEKIAKGIVLWGSTW